MARLGDICKFQSGGTPPKGEPSYFNGNIPWITTVALNGSVIGKENAVDWITEKAIENSAAKIVPANSVMVGTRVGVGKVATNNVPMSTSQDIISLIDIDEQKWSKAFICKFILGKGSYLNSQARGATIKGIKIDTLAELQLPDMKLEEQKKISNILDGIDKLYLLRKQQISKLDELAKARFVELFGECEERKHLEEYASLITKGASPKWQGVDYCEEGTLFVTSENVREGYLDLSKRKYLDDKINEIQPRSILKRNDKLINIVGASIGRAAVYDCDEVANINQAVALVRVDYSQINQTYLMAFLNSPQAIEMYGKMKKGGARDNLSLQNIADLQIPVAPMELQNLFATFVKQTDKSKLSIQQSLEKLETLKKALMQKYFG